MNKRGCEHFPPFWSLCYSKIAGCVVRVIGFDKCPFYGEQCLVEYESDRGLTRRLVPLRDLRIIGGGWA